MTWIISNWQVISLLVMIMAQSANVHSAFVFMKPFLPWSILSGIHIKIKIQPPSFCDAQLHRLTVAEGDMWIWRWWICLFLGLWGRELNWCLSINTCTICACMKFHRRASWAFVKVKIHPSDVSIYPWMREPEKIDLNRTFTYLWINFPFQLAVPLFPFKFLLLPEDWKSHWPLNVLKLDGFFSV